MANNRKSGCFGCLLSLVLVALVLAWAGLGVRYLMLDSSALTESEVSQAGTDMAVPYSPAEVATMVRDSQSDVAEWKDETQRHLASVTGAIAVVIVVKLLTRHSRKPKRPDSAPS